MNKVLETSVKDLKLKHGLIVVAGCYVGKVLINAAATPLYAKLNVWTKRQEFKKAAEKRDKNA